MLPHTRLGERNEEKTARLCRGGAEAQVKPGRQAAKTAIKKAAVKKKALKNRNKETAK